MPRRIILDVDTGTDDAVALMVAALSPELELLGVTTVAGNCAVTVCTENTLRVLDTIGVSVPVYEGMAQPVTRPDVPRLGPSVIHGDYLDLPPASTRKQAQHAVTWLIETLLASDGDVTLVPVGPLTNIATAMRMEPRILPKIRELVIMGGAHRVGNQTASAEFNIWYDPEAARIVLNCGRPICLVMLDATHQTIVSLEDCQRFRALNTPAGRAAAICIERLIASYVQLGFTHRDDAAVVHDALAVCATIDPTVIGTEFVYVDVETEGELTRGRTVCDMRYRTEKDPNVFVAVEADQDKFIQMLNTLLGYEFGPVEG